MRSLTPPDLAGRCPRCFLRLTWCVCADLRPIETRTEVVCVRHMLERWKTTNTARLAALALPRMRLVDYGLPEGLPELPAFTPEDTMLVYPDGEGDPIPPGVRRLLVIDGTWSQSKKMLARLGSVRRLPRLVLPPPPVRARLRKEHMSEGMATVEAIAEALRAVEGDAPAEALHRVHELFISRVLAARGDTIADLLANRHGAPRTQET